MSNASLDIFWVIGSTWSLFVIPRTRILPSLINLGLATDTVSRLQPLHNGFGHPGSVLCNIFLFPPLSLYRCIECNPCAIFFCHSNKNTKWEKPIFVSPSSTYSLVDQDRKVHSAIIAVSMSQTLMIPHSCIVTGICNCDLN